MSILSDLAVISAPHNFRNTSTDIFANDVKYLSSQGILEYWKICKRFSLKGYRFPPKREILAALKTFGCYLLLLQLILRPLLELVIECISYLRDLIRTMLSMLEI